MLLGLGEQRAQGFGHVGEAGLVRLLHAFAVVLELLGLEREVGFERTA